MNILAASMCLLQTPTAVAAPVDPFLEACRTAARYSAEREGHSFLVWRDELIVFEDYPNGNGPDVAHPLASGTKSFWGVAAMCAVADGMLTLDESACTTLTEWKDDQRRSKIQVRHLLNLSCGLEPSHELLQGARTRDKYAAALTVPAISEPGAVFRYGPAAYFAFGALLERKLFERREDPLAYLERRVLKPIGLSYARWTRDAEGQPALPHGAFLTAREWAKFGAFLVRGGRPAPGVDPILEPKLLAQCFEPSSANPRYGLTFWLGFDAESDVTDGPLAKRLLKERTEREIAKLDPALFASFPKDFAMAAGKGKQRLYLFPSWKLVVVRQGDSGVEFSDIAQLAPIIAALATATLPPPIKRQQDREE